MLVQLTISDFAIIRHLEIGFHPGLNILSGETGAGKSIIVNAVNLILGGRASTDLIRSGSKEARVEALFTLPDNPAVRSFLAEQDLPFEGELLIRRILSREGRNRIHVNGSLVTLQTLSRLGGLLMSISGQHEHQLLLRPENHLHILDDFGGLTPERLRLGEVYGAYQSLLERLRVLDLKIKEGEERQELAGFQIDEIDRADIQPGEDESLAEEKGRLQNAEELLQILRESYDVLYESETAVLANISHCLKRLERGAVWDSRLGPIRDALRSSGLELEETALALRDLLGGISIDPGRLEAVDERIDRINRLKRKYGPTLADICAFRGRLAEGMEGLDQQREARRETGAKLRETEAALISGARELSEKRRRAAKRLEKSVEKELCLLGMQGTRFEVRFSEGSAPKEGAHGQVKADGLDTLEFTLSPNIGEALKPLARIASGGELSRMMLALKTILAGTSYVETIVFDEVDAGIGGATAAVVGGKLEALAGYHQVLCITHLPQIASRKAAHFRVAKETAGGRTETNIRELDPQERVEEIARLLGGASISDKAMAHAREMLG